MKKTTILIALLLALVSAVGLCACGGGAAAPAEENADQNQLAKQYQTDKATLEAAGYTVTFYTGEAYLAPIEEANGVPTGSLEAWLTAIKNDYSALVAYYFKSADEAATFIDRRSVLSPEEERALKGKVVILNDTDGLISK